MATSPRSHRTLARLPLAALPLTALLLLLLLPARASAAPPDCSGGPDDWIATLRSGADMDSYLCLAYAQGADDLLLTAASVDSLDKNTANRLTRALALNMILRLDQPVVVEQSRVLNGADRRLVADAVRARRGRRCADAEHARVFAQFDWYQPDDSYNDSRLTDLDRANRALIDSPPPVVKVDGSGSAADAVAEGTGTSSFPRGVCGCSSASGSAPGWTVLLLLAGLVGALRRR